MNRLKRIFIQNEADFAYRFPHLVNRCKGSNDEFGFDLEYFAKVELYLRFLREDMFKTIVIGAENIPNEGAAILAGNHNGVLPLDAYMLIDAVVNEHPKNRLVRFMAHECFFWHDKLRTFMRCMGEIPAIYDYAEKLIARRELVGLYPAGERSMGQPLNNRYGSGEFRTGCIRLAIATQTPIVPVITIGNVETHPMIFNAKLLANLFEMPYFGVTPFFPLLPFPFGFTPLPAKWLIHIGKPIYFDHPPEAAADKKLLSDLTWDLQQHIQKNTDAILAMRKSAFRGWDRAEVLEWAKDANHEFATRT